MKNWKKYAFASASVVALAAGLAACGNLSGNSKKAADSASGEKTVIKMYQIGDKPDNLDELLENANKIIGEKVGAKLDIQYLGWGDYDKKMSVITSSGENYDIAFASNYVVNAQKGAYADLTDLYKKEGAELYKALTSKVTALTVKFTQFQLQPTLHHLKTSPSTELFLLNTVSIFQVSLHMKHLNQS